MTLGKCLNLSVPQFLLEYNGDDSGIHLPGLSGGHTYTEPTIWKVLGLSRDCQAEMEHAALPPPQSTCCRGATLTPAQTPQPGIWSPNGRQPQSVTPKCTRSTRPAPGTGDTEMGKTDPTAARRDLTF